MNARVSVLLPYRDSGRTIDAALSGLLSEADPEREVIAIDDGSTDSGPARVATWARRDARVRMLDSGGRGLVPALALGALAARGALLARMDADDVAHPARLSRQRSHLLANPHVSVLGTRVRAFVEDGHVGEGLALYVSWQNALITPADHARERFVESPLCHPSIMLRREAFEAVGGYRDVDGPEDYELFLRLCARGYALAKLPDELLAWRHHAGRATFGDARYGLAKFRAVKAPHLAEAVRATGRARLAVWGAGPTGRRLARALSAHGARPALFIDVDPGKVGRTAQEVKVCDADALRAETDVVVVAVGARGVRALIRPELDRRGFVEGVSYWFAA